MKTAAICRRLRRCLTSYSDRRGSNPASSAQVPGSSAMTFDFATGVEKLIVVLSPSRVPELERDFGPQGAMAGGDSNASALQNLDKSLVKWSRSSRQAIPVGERRGARRAGRLRGAADSGRAAR